MDKLLHERMREYVKKSDEEHSYPTVVVGREDLIKFADEIERCYIPIPVDENGELWEIGDACIAYDDETSVCGYGKYGGVFAFDENKSAYNIIPPDYIKRPAPKVLDADGVEIKVGDTVWTSMYADNPYTVDQISTNSKGDPIVMVNEMGSGLFPATCYHEPPVFDADGVRICKGDTVWEIFCGCEMTVTGITASSDITGRPIVHTVYKSTGKKDVHGAKHLTHHEPDSLEKIERDMRQHHEDWVSDPNEWLNVADRISAIIERGA